MLKIFNTLTGKKEEFKPIDTNQVSMYVCGVTIYDLCHIGHGRTFVSFDIIARYLCYLGYNLKYVRNVTDIDDKIIKRAIESNETCNQLTQRMLIEMHKDFDELNIIRIDIEPKATDHIPEIIKIIEKLILRKHAYIASNGDIMFSVNSYPNYGLLSRQNLKKLQIGKRVKIIDIKHNPLDFVLWKISELNEPHWESPWGAGRPGWHIECSAMTYKQLGSHFDIHGGGADLMFPHHDNEIAQSSCAHDGPHVNYWIHSGMVIIDREKMSKSLGNHFTIREILKNHDGEELRYFLLSSHYRSQLNYSPYNLKHARLALERLYTALQGTDPNVKPEKDGGCFEKQFREAMDDDFNTPKAFSILFDLARAVNRLKSYDMTRANAMAAELRKLATILGLLKQDPEIFLKKIIYTYDNQFALIEKMIKQRQDARIAKKWETADSIRDKLNDLGIILEDNFKNTTWRGK
ncbi:cysteine--tRNA ligase [Candidatus Profftia sp. (ex Adelges kitamiensis)]|uniref:cysteine--tRNA ligase n=1 Tax=Candidatus Profftia sp. (ex Adelges kitamiensis) TaxID=2864218 RepID=UPI001CE2B277|nr:cysteine--tRNA ligase [Candidatus Profftia sp. (ex Adelges kitamiensis)]